MTWKFTLKNCDDMNVSLPPAYVVWWKVMFSLCLSFHTWWGGGFPSLWSQIPSQPLVPHPFLGVPYPLIPCLFQEYPSPGWYPGQGYPPDWGTPWPGQDWGTLPARTGLGYPQPGQDWSTPRDWLCCVRYASCSFPQEDFLVLFEIKLEIFHANFKLYMLCLSLLWTYKTLWHHISYSIFQN